MVMRDYFHSDDNLLVSWTIDGDQRAYSELVRRYEKMVAGTVKGMLGNVQQAEDVGQETFIRLYNSLSSFRGDSKLSTYIQRIAINLSLNELKRNKRFVSLFTRAKDANDATEREIPDISSESESDRDLKEILEKSIEALPAEFKTIVVLRLILGYSTKESAEVLELPIGTVLSRLSRAKEQLKNEINNLM
jgi:RNA polymerase sigma-70 factor (ECF subfamily)